MTTVVKARPFIFKQLNQPNYSKLPILKHKLGKVIKQTELMACNKKNFPSYLKNIIDPNLFNKDLIEPFMPAYKDPLMKKYANSEKLKYICSTSSMTSTMCHIYFVLSSWKNPNLSSFPDHFRRTYFSPSLTTPCTVDLIYKNEKYGIYKVGDSMSSFLSELGVQLEKYFTLSRPDFQKYFSENNIFKPNKNQYHYSTFDKFVLRAQLDCCDTNDRGRIFDLKTRATYPIRMDYTNYSLYEGYQLRTLKGELESFEKELYDLIRSAFLKYYFQAKIGLMDGVFVAYHNTFNLFGFQYFSMKDMESYFPNSELSDDYFNTIIKILGHIYDEITKIFPKKTLRVIFESQSCTSMLHLYVLEIGNQTEEQVLKAKKKKLHKYIVDIKTNQLGNKLIPMETAVKIVKSNDNYNAIRDKYLLLKVAQNKFTDSRQILSPNMSPKLPSFLKDLRILSFNNLNK